VQGYMVCLLPSMGSLHPEHSIWFDGLRDQEPPKIASLSCWQVLRRSEANNAGDFYNPLLGTDVLTI
jgi:hypothetical protein